MTTTSEVVETRFVNIVTVSGDFSGTQWVGVAVFDQSTRGELYGFVVRQDTTGGNASRVENLAFVHTYQGLTLTSAPPEEHLSMLVEGFDTTADAAQASASGTSDPPGGFANGLAIQMRVTASGAFQFEIGVDARVAYLVLP